MLQTALKAAARSSIDDALADACINDEDDNDARPLMGFSRLQLALQDARST